MAINKVMTLENLEYFKGQQDAFNEDKFASKASVPTKVSDLSNDLNYQTKANLDTAIQAAINTAVASVMTYKGAKDTAEELPPEGNKLGDVWHVNADSAEYAWDGTKWEALGTTMNISVAWSDITGKPSTFTPSEHQHDDATSSASGFMSASDKTKLDGIAAGATKYTHPNSAAGAKSSGLYKIGTDAQGHVTSAASVVKTDITSLGIPAQDTTYSDATTSASGLMSSTDKSKLDGIASGATKVTVDTSLSDTSLNPVQNKVVKTALDGKAPTSHGHSMSQITGLEDALADKSDTEHTHTAAQITDLQSKLDGKANVSHTHSIASTSANGFMSSSDKQKLDGISPNANAYIHPSSDAGAKTSGLYKITTDESGHVVGAVAVAKSDITALGIPAQDTNTTYNNATQSVSGLMSSSDKTKLDSMDVLTEITEEEIDSIFTAAASVDAMF